MSRKFKSLLNLTTLTADPLGSAGDVFFNTTEKALKIHNGITWVNIAKSDDPTPFYMHTHTYDGDVHTIDINDPITFKDFSGNGVQLTLPIIDAVFGGAPADNISLPSAQQLTLFDGGDPSGNTIYSSDISWDGGSSGDTGDDTPIDGGGA